MQFRSELILNALPEAKAELMPSKAGPMHRGSFAADELQLLTGIKVYILPVCGADYFYTDGGSVGTTYKIEMSDSSLNYLLSDETVRDFVQQKTRI